ncbi:MAG: insulinase family protein [Polyangiaceae bacterium]|nr:insulinase family protein [Polyangiaceae bacterium]
MSLSHRLVPAVLATTLSAATARAAPQIPVEQYTLANGLTVITNRDTRLPVVAVEVRYLVGSGNERPGRTGFAHLFEHLMFEGSGSYDHEYFKPFEPIGGSPNGTTSQDRTNYFERVPSNYLELALWMESDRMENFLPVLTQSKLDNQRDVVLNERRQRYIDQPYGMAHEYLSAALYPVGHPYHHTTIGDPDDVSAASLADVQAFFSEYYVPSNAVLTVAGDFEPGSLRELVELYFGHIPAGKRAVLPAPPTPTVTELRHVVQTDDVKLSRIYLAWLTPPLYAPDDAELDILATVLSHGKTSRLFQPLVYEKKVAKDVSAYQASHQLTSFFLVQATAAPDVNVDELHRELMAALRAALDTPPTEAELTAAVNAYKKDYYARLESVVERAGLLSTYFHKLGTADYLTQDLERYAHTTSDQVAAAARRYLDLERHVRVDIVPGVKAGGAK